MNEKLKGILPALMVAFTEGNESIDKEKVAMLTKSLKNAGVHGLYVGGSSAEMVLCSVNERKELLETVMDASEDMAIIAHVGAMSGADTIELARHSASLGADAVSSVTPLYYKYSFKEIKHFYSKIAESSGLPVIIYNIPALTGTTLNFEQLSELLSLDGVAGMKFTSSDFFQLNRLKTEFPDKVIYNGCDEMLLSGLAAGADGGIGTTYNFMPEVILSVYNNFLAGDIASAQKSQTLANRVIERILRHGVLASSKYLISLSQLDYGICREPLLPLDEAAKADLYENAYKLYANSEF